jgi:hypothetical protein
MYDAIMRVGRSDVSPVPKQVGDSVKEDLTRGIQGMRERKTWGKGVTRLVLASMNGSDYATKYMYKFVYYPREGHTYENDIYRQALGKLNELQRKRGMSVQEHDKAKFILQAGNSKDRLYGSPIQHYKRWNDRVGDASRVIRMLSPGGSIDLDVLSVVLESYPRTEEAANSLFDVGGAAGVNRKVAVRLLGAAADRGHDAAQVAGKALNAALNLEELAALDKSWLRYEQSFFKAIIAET